MFDGSLLAREINWLETFTFLTEHSSQLLMSPYSLGKLIDWKHQSNTKLLETGLSLTPYSLGKLIDWKQSLISTELGGVFALPTR